MQKLILVLFLSSTFSLVYAQKDVNFDASPSFLDRVFVGGGLGFSADSYVTSVSLSPIVGYMITPNLSAGVGIQYQYVKYKQWDVSDNTYGGNIFTRYNISQFFLQGEYNVINLEMSPFDDIKNRKNYDRLLFGGGISQPLGSRARLNILGMYDFMFKENGVFASPWVFRVYISA